LSILYGQQAPVADGDAVGITAEILQHVRRASEGGLGVNDPVFRLQRGQESGEGARSAQRSEVSEKAQGAIEVSFAESLQYEAPEESGEDFDGEKESAAGGDPTFMVGRETAAGNDAMQVGVEVQVLAPTMENAEEAELQSETFCRGAGERLGGGVEEDAVDDLFVIEGKGRNLLWQGEDHMEILGGQQFGAPVLQPVLACDALTLGAMAVAAGSIPNVSELAVVAPFDGAAQAGRTAGFDGLHQAVLMQRQGMRPPVRRAVLSEDVGQLQSWLRQVL
jgi:hypothetical protein